MTIVHFIWFHHRFFQTWSPIVRLDSQTYSARVSREVRSRSEGMCVTSQDICFVEQGYLNRTRKAATNLLTEFWYSLSLKYTQWCLHQNCILASPLKDRCHITILDKLSRTEKLQQFKKQLNRLAWMSLTLGEIEHCCMFICTDL
jgi:hypothetical protein